MTRRTDNGDGAGGLIAGYSIEMTGKDVLSLQEARTVLPKGSRVNVTFLGSENLDLRVAAAKAVTDAGLVPVPHISARRVRSDAELVEILSRLREVGATRHLFAAGGDPSKSEGPFDDALALIQSGRLAAHGVQEVGIAGYPEGHPSISTDRLWGAFDDKVAALRDQDLPFTVISQFAFDSTSVLAWIDAVRNRGIDATLRVGTPGPAGAKRLLGFARRFGVGSSAGIVKKYGLSLTNLMGTAGPDRFVADLAAALGGRGDVRLHFYAFGGLLATARWAQDFAAEHAGSAS